MVWLWAWLMGLVHFVRGVLELVPHKWGEHCTRYPSLSSYRAVQAWCVGVCVRMHIVCVCVCVCVCVWQGGGVARWQGGEVARWRGGEVARQ